MSLLFVLLFFILGTIIGSFLNVLVVRGHEEKSLGGRSACVHCYKQIPNIYLIPVLGYFFSGRKCFSCKKPISVRYVIGEFAVGLLFVGAYCWLVVNFFYPGVLEIILVLVILVWVTTLAYISYYDILYQEIPTSALVALLVTILGMHGLFSQILMGPGLIDSLLQGLIGTGVCIPFFIIWLISRGRLIGLGDILIMALIGLHLGLSLGGSAVLLAFWTGSIFGIFFIMYQKIIYNKDYSQIRTIPVPFGPFLIISWLFTYMHQFNILSLFL